MDYMKDSSGGLKLCDYVTLNLEKSEGHSANTTDTFPWFIPNSAYYSDRRSQVSTVEIIAGVLRSSETGGVDNNLLITYEKGGFNHYTTDNERPVIGYYNVLDPLVKGTGELLVNARPQEIRLKITTLDGSRSTGDLTGSVTLKFKYYNSIQSSAQLHSEYSPLISL
jgi:hypothetical protein